MSGYKLGKRSLKNLKGVHPDLERVVRRAIQITKQDFTVIEGRRTVARQRELVRKGFSKTMNSRHITGHAVDVVPYPIAHRLSYPNYKWKRVANAMKQAAHELGVDLDWGADLWKGWDKPHFQLSWRNYPK